MSLNLLTQDSKKTWLNARVNELAVDSNIKSYNPDRLYAQLSYTGVVDTGVNSLSFLNINTLNYTGRTYQACAVYTVTHNGVNETDLKINFRVTNNDNNVVLYDGKQFVVKGTDTQQTISLIDKFYVIPEITKNFKLEIVTETNATGADRPDIDGNVIINSITVL